MIASFPPFPFFLQLPPMCRPSHLAPLEIMTSFGCGEKRACVPKYINTTYSVYVGLFYVFEVRADHLAL